MTTPFSRRTWSLALAFAATTASMGAAVADDPRAKLTKNGSYPDHVKGWTTFAVQGTKLGSPLEQVPGFTCGPPPGTDGFTTQNHSCVKFTDARCKGKPTKIHHIRTASDIPKGQTCFMDEFTGATYVDGAYAETPLQNIRLVGTNTTAPLVFQIHWILPADDLTEDSNLGKALLAKYGTPTYSQMPRDMSWDLGDLRLAASCNTQGGVRYCEIVAEDRTIDSTERGLQDEADDAARKRAAPAAPNL